MGFRTTDVKPGDLLIRRIGAPASDEWVARRAYHVFYEKSNLAVRNEHGFARLVTSLPNGEFDLESYNSALRKTSLNIPQPPVRNDMNTDEIPTAELSNWEPIANKHELGVLGKLGEEVNELGAAIFRCIIQGLDEKHPETGKINRDWLQDEFADVLALMQIAEKRLGLDVAVILHRRDKKVAYKTPWFDSLLSDTKEKTNLKLQWNGLPPNTAKSEAHWLKRKYYSKGGYQLCGWSAESKEWFQFGVKETSSPEYISTVYDYIKPCEEP